MNKALIAYSESESVIGITKNSSTKPNNLSDRMDFVSISIPQSPTADQLQSPRRTQFSDDDKTAPTEEVQYSAPASSDTKLVMPMPAKFYSQPLSHGSMREEAANSANIQGYTAPQKINGSTDSLRDTAFDSFRTCPGKLGRQLSVYWRKLAEPGPEPNNLWSAETEDVPMDRYFDALEGPELETFKQSEELLLKRNKAQPHHLKPNCIEPNLRNSLQHSHFTPKVSSHDQGRNDPLRSQQGSFGRSATTNSDPNPPSSTTHQHHSIIP